MGKINKLITISPELDDALKKEENASLLIRKLLEQHYSEEQSDDLDFLEKKRIELDNEREILGKRCEQLTNRILDLSRKKQASREKKERSRVIKYRKWLWNKEILPKWQSGEMSDEEYFTLIKEWKTKEFEVPHDWNEISPN